MGYDCEPANYYGKADIGRVERRNGFITVLVCKQCCYEEMKCRCQEPDREPISVELVSREGVNHYKINRFEIANFQLWKVLLGDVIDLDSNIIGISSHSETEKKVILKIGLTDGTIVEVECTLVANDYEAKVVLADDESYVEV